MTVGSLLILGYLMIVNHGLGGWSCIVEWCLCDEWWVLWWCLVVVYGCKVGMITGMCLGWLCQHVGLHASGPKNCMCPLVWPITYPAQKFPIVPRTHSGNLPPILGRGGCLNNPPHGLIYKYNVWSRYIFNRQITVFYQIPFNDLMGFDAVCCCVEVFHCITWAPQHWLSCLVRIISLFTYVLPKTWS